MILYRDDHRPGLDEARELYRASTLGERRPVDDDARFAAMLAHANLIVTAWDGAQLVGISRCTTDFVWTTYLADLAVRAAHQRRGIGRELIRRTQAAAPQAKLLLLGHAFEVLDCIAVEFRTHWHNLQSRRAIAELGAKQDGVLRNHHLWRDGTLRDTVVFSIIASEWPSVRLGLKERLAAHD